MEQHPVPQQISSYQFRLVGDMTLKQFFQVAAGVIIALIVYSTGLWGIIKWPLMIFSAATGAAFAFVPYKDRPLTAWVTSFFRAIYSTTEFRWRKYDKYPDYFAPENTEGVAGQPQVSDNQIQAGSPKTKGQAVKPSFMTNLESAEKDFLSNISNLLKGNTTAQPAVAAQANISPQQPPVATNQQVVLPTGSQPQGQVTQINVQAQSDTNSNVKLNPPPTVKIPEVQQPEVAQEQATQQIITNQLPNIPTSVGQISTTPTSPQAYMPQFSVNAAPPMPPEYPNTVVGQVMDSEGKIIEGAILEIKDDAGRPVRALKTNKLGHFMIVTPVQNGTYRLTSEKQGYTFNEISFEAKGDLIPPMAIKSTGKFNPEGEPAQNPLQPS